MSIRNLTVISALAIALASAPSFAGPNPNTDTWKCSPQAAVQSGNTLMFGYLNGMGLSMAQEGQIRAILAHATERIKAIRADSGLPAKEKIRRLQAVHHLRSWQIVHVLTPEQAKLYRVRLAANYARIRSSHRQS